MGALGRSWKINALVEAVRAFFGHFLSLLYGTADERFGLYAAAHLRMQFFFAPKAGTPKRKVLTA